MGAHPNDNYSDDDAYDAAGGAYSDDDGAAGGGGDAGYAAAGDAAPAQTPAPVGPLAAPADPFKTRRYLITLRGSLAQLASGQAAAVWQPVSSDAAVPMFSTSAMRAAAGTSAEKQKAAMRQSLLKGVEFYSVQSDFPVAVGLRFADMSKPSAPTALEFARGNCFSSTGERFAYIVPANFTKPYSEQDPISVVVPSNSLNSEFLTNYSQWTLDNLHTAYNPAPDDPRYVYVRPDAPHIGVINAAYQANNQPLITSQTHGSKDVGGMIRVPLETVKACEKMIASDMLTNLPIVNLANFGVQFGRAEHSATPATRTLAASASLAPAAAWVDPVGLFSAGSAVSSAARQRVLDQEFSLSIMAGVSFRQMLSSPATADAAADAAPSKSSRRSKK